jgi:hypothetical protein
MIAGSYGRFCIFGWFWTMKNKANFRERQKEKGKRKNESKTGVSPVGYLKKQSQFISYCVLRDAYREKVFEKTKPICGRAKLSQSLI